VKNEGPGAIRAPFSFLSTYFGSQDAERAPKVEGQLNETELPVLSRWRERLPIARERPLLAVAAMLGVVIVALALRFVADPGLPSGFPYVTFFPAVIVTSFLFGARIGSACAAICGLLAWYFFIGTFGFDGSSGTMIALAFYVFVVATDIVLIDWMQRANANLAHERERNRALADTRELLFRELQHRVSNNLQVVGGLLSLQKRHVTDEGARLALGDASRRLSVIGRISRQLYETDGQARGMRAFLAPLVTDVIEASGRTDIAFRLQGTDDASLSPDALIPLALIVAEAVANALEHGFAHRDHGTIVVELRRAGSDIVVDVRDDGAGLPEGFDLRDSGSLGLRIATMLAGQLGGRFELFTEAGTTARLTLPATAEA